MQLEQARRIARRCGERQAERSEQGGEAVAVGVRRAAERGGQSRRKHHADRDRLAVQQGAVAGRGLERVSEACGRN